MPTEQLGDMLQPLSEQPYVSLIGKIDPEKPQGYTIL